MADANALARDVDDQILKPIKELMIRIYADGAPYRLNTLKTVSEKDEDHEHLNPNEILRDIEDPVGHEIKEVVINMAPKPVGPAFSKIVVADIKMPEKKEGNYFNFRNPFSKGVGRGRGKFGVHKKILPQAPTAVPKIQTSPNLVVGPSKPYFREAPPKKYVTDVNLPMVQKPEVKAPERKVEIKPIPKAENKVEIKINQPAPDYEGIAPPNISSIESLRRRLLERVVAQKIPNVVVMGKTNTR